MNNRQKQLLIFDLDGTLIDSVPDIAVATNAMLQDLGKCTFSQDIIRNWVGNGSKKLIERALLHANKHQNPDREAIHTNDDINIAENLFFKHYGDHSASKTAPYEGVTDGLQSLYNAGYTLALVTNKPIQFVPEILHSLGWSGQSDLFSIVLGGDSLEHKKPSPVPLNHVCEKLKFHVKQSYMIGDSKNDILAGQNANMETIGLSYGYNYGQDIREFAPTHCFDNFTDMVNFLLK